MIESMVNVEAEFGAAMAAYGLRPPEIIADGKFHSFVTDDETKRGNKAGWYKLFGDGNANGIFGDYNTSLSEKWSVKSQKEMTAAERTQYRQRIESAKMEADASRVRIEAEAAKRCEAIWESANDASDENPYLIRKGIKAHGLKEFKDTQTLIVPVSGGDGRLTSLQFISADGSKKFKANGRTKGCFHHFGDDNAEVMLICEGYATAASLFEITHYPVVVAFNVGNLDSVSKAIRKQYPDTLIVVCADNDRFGTTGNIGIEKAEAAAYAVSGALAVPVFLSDDNESTDFNDLHQTFGAPAVSEIIEKAIAAAMAPTATTPAVVEMEGAVAMPDPVEMDRPAPKKKAPAKRSPDGVLNGFTVTEQGVFYVEDDDSKSWICSRLDVQALVRDGASENWGRLLAWQDADHVHHRWSLPMELLKSDGADMRGELARMGLDIAPGMKARTKLSEYVITSKPAARARCVVRTGWHGKVFVLPDRTVGTSSEMVIYQSEMSHSEYSTKGTLQEWQQNVSAYCSGNPRLFLRLRRQLNPQPSQQSPTPTKAGRPRCGRLPRTSMRKTLPGVGATTKTQ